MRHRFSFLPAVWLGLAVPSPQPGLPINATDPRSQQCAFDTAAATRQVSIALGIAPGLRGQEPESIPADYLIAAEAVRQHFRRPDSLTLPLWARTRGPETRPDTSDLVGSGLDSRLSFRLDRLGRLADTTITVSTASPELDASLIAAVRRADSAAAFDPPSDELRKRDGKIELRLIEWSMRKGPAVGLVRLSIPVVQADMAVDVISIPTPAYPPRARQGGYSGFVELQYVVLENGRVDPASFRIIDGRYFEFARPAPLVPELARSAIEAIRRGRFKPARVGACPVPMLVQQKVYFNIGR